MSANELSTQDAGAEAIGRHNGWTFDPAREIWWAKTGPGAWSEVKGALDDPPAWRAGA